MIWISPVSTDFCRLLLLLAAVSMTGCATTGVDNRPGSASANGQAVPAYVRNLPKSRTGNMAQYTVFGKKYRVMDSAANFSETGIASWYGKKFHGRKTSSGEVYDMYAMTAAHKHLPLPTYVRVTNLDNNKSVVVKVNDRGPFVGDRIIDMSYTAAHELDMVEKGTANVRVDALSTHLIAQNSSASNVMVAKSFTDDPSPNNVVVPPPVAPEVVQPQLAAVPLQPEPEVVKSTPEAPGLLAAQEVDVDSSEDGFTEISLVPAQTTAAAPVVQEPAAVQALNPVKQAVVSKAANRSGNYFIQLGAFSNAANAQGLVTSVEQQTGLPAFVEKDTGRKLFRVKMGPFKKGTQLESTLSTLASIGVDGYTKLAASR